MIAATCPACNAQFDVDFAPGTEFTCGACDAIVTTPSPAPRVQPKAAPKRPAPALKRAPAAPTSGLPQRSAADHGKAAAAKKPMGLIIGGGLGVVALVVILVIALGNSGDEGGSGEGQGGGGDRSASRGGNGGNGGGTPEPEVELTPYQKARKKARLVNVAFEDMVNFAELAWNEAQKVEGAEARKPFVRDYEWTYKRMLKTDPDHATARRRLGYVAFSLAEAKSWMNLPGLAPSLKGEIEFAVEDAEDRGGGKNPTKVKWLSRKKDQGREWAAIRRGVERFKKLQADRLTDPFYKQAENVGKQLADELANPARMGGARMLRKGVTGHAFQVFTQYKPYVLLVQKDPSIQIEKEAEKWGSILEDLRRSFWDKFATKLGIGKMDRLTPIIVLFDSTEYAKYIRRNDKFAPVTSGAHYEPWSNRLVCYRVTDEKDRSVLFHEGTHQLVNFCMRGARPGAGQRQAFWFSEGMAEYFAGYGKQWNEDLGNWNYLPGTVYVDKIDLLVSARDRKELMSIEDLCQYSRARSNSDRADPTRSRRYSIAYAQGWAMMYFLNNWQDRKYAEQFLTYLREEFAGRTGLSAFQKAFGSDLASMEKEFDLMVTELEAAKKEGRILNGELVPKKGD